MPRSAIETIWRCGAQAHLDPLGFVVPQRNVLEAVGVEGRAEFAVEHVQHVAVERGGDPLRVVVGSQEPVPVLHQVGAEQEPSPWAICSRGRRGTGPLLRLEVPDRASQEGDESLSFARDPVEWWWKSPDHGVDLSPGYSSATRWRPPQRPVSDVEGHVATQRARPLQGVEQDP